MNRFPLNALNLCLFVGCLFYIFEPELFGCRAEMRTTIKITSLGAQAAFTEVPKGDAVGNPFQIGSDIGLETREPAGWNREIALNNDWSMVLAPGRVLYPQYIADPRRTTFFNLSRMYFFESEIEGAGDDRLGVRLGASLGLLGLHEAGDLDHGFQLDIEAGFMAQFDLDHATDNIGWDGIYGFHLAWVSPRGYAIRSGIMHDSSHVGDEHAERTGRQRINYTREELLLGLSWSFTEKWRIYCEGAYGYDLRNEEIMEPWRLQYGMEYVSPKSLWNQRLGWYAAADVSTFEENDWDQNLTLQMGLMLRTNQLVRDYRLAVEYYEGRSQIGEFFQDDETYLSLGIWIDI